MRAVRGLGAIKRSFADDCTTLPLARSLRLGALHTASVWPLLRPVSVNLAPTSTLICPLGVQERHTQTIFSAPLMLYSPSELMSERLEVDFLPTR